MKKTPSILLVDDDPASNYLAKLLLLEIDPEFDIHVRYHGQEALEYIKAADGEIVSPNLIFLDLNMPRMNGKELLREIKTDPGLKNIPVVVYTTSSQKKDREEAISSGAVAFLSKPSNMRDLKNALADLVGSLPQKPAIAPPAC